MLFDKDFILTEQNVNTYIQEIAEWIKGVLKGANCKGVVLGLSGGVDSSTVAALCHTANVPTELVLMPYGSNIKNSNSYTHAMELINKFNFSYHVFDIKPAVDALAVSSNELDSSKNNLVYANIRPRVRMTYLYQFAGLNNYLVIGTSNMSERVLGYFTKWGDGSCDLNPLGLLTKKEVYILAKALNIPDSIISKEPSAELWEGQTDEKELGMTYREIDEYILNGTSGSSEIDSLIESKILLSKHKIEEIPIFKETGK